MLRLALVALAVGLADSLNPSTVGPALYLATVANGALRALQFTIGVFAVNLLVGLILTLGPGSLLLGLLPHPQHTARHVIELVAGGVLLVVAVALWLGRRNLASRELPMHNGDGGSALIAGSTIAAVELPTAVPYFALVLAIVGSGAHVPVKIGLVCVYNVAFVLPLLTIPVALLIAGERADRWLQTVRAWLQRRWPVVLATLLLVVGGALIVVGGAGLVKS